MTKIYHQLSLAATGITLSLFAIGLFLYTSKSDWQGCSLSPDNAGCELNRPIDIKRNAEQEKHEALAHEALLIQNPNWASSDSP